MIFKLTNVRINGKDGKPIDLSQPVKFDFPNGDKVIHSVLSRFSFTLRLQLEALTITTSGKHRPLRIAPLPNGNPRDN